MSLPSIGEAPAVAEVFDSIDAVPAELWDAAVAASGAPVFYERRYLAAYEASPLAPCERAAYLVARSGSSSAAVLPALVQPELDPLGQLRRAFPSLRLGGRGLVTPGWHCYDGWVPAARLEPGALEGLLEGLRRVAREAGVEWVAFLNVREDSPLRHLLEAAGPVATGPIEARHTMELDAFRSYDAYVESLRPKMRRNVRRYGRRAAEAGAEIRVTRAAEADLDAIVELAHATAAKFGTGDFYRSGPFQEFVRRLGDSAVAIELRLAGRLLAAFVCLVDGRRFHGWTCGIGDAVVHRFSPYTLLFAESVRVAIERGLPTFEGGRGNGASKIRFGLTPRVLHAYVFHVGADAHAPVGTEEP